MTAATTPRWLRLGLAGVFGALAGAVLFPTRAEGRSSNPRSPDAAKRALTGGLRR